ncbi:NAD-dependent malic enzyme [Paenibacillus eucommiae]|uniref:Malate dehydrogenase (Oxaloacetate-decarboxylating) n=1 Tax=Paenibacillus eucommiae TaxID=1355755 RepID=A0ABS4IN71_9BACL|nr:NAD-dependent malic enzyme [Paenibacillus eucommiae]MBP1989013.1 malate dehydrogenase (oxaloacetate-decarboxylating) [Paenibacillus eucommiae]
MAVNTSIIIRLEIDKTKVSFGEVVNAISKARGDVVAIDVIHAGQIMTTRDITVNLSEFGSDRIRQELEQVPGLRVVNISDSTFLVHLGGKIEIQPKLPIKNRDDLSKVYTPGVARVCMAIHEDKSKAYSLTIKRNTVAVISDGTAVLGLGDIGPEAAMPVMEGKAMLFKQLAGVDAFPICLETKDVEEIIRTIKAIAPAFGGINLEDISSPRCFEIEKRLQEELDIPVFHDDQHGTAVVVLAGLLNSLKVVGKNISSIRVVVMGIGAAGVACCKILLAAGVQDLVAVDRQGAIVSGGGPYANPMWNWLAEHSNPNRMVGTLSDVIAGADVFVGVSGPGLLKVEDVQKMAADPIVFAMANPEPEIDPEVAEPYVRVLATGRSDFPNQINNVLVFPGIFRGALDCQAKIITEEMKLAAARAIASVVTEEELNEQYIIPSIFNDKVVQLVRNEVIRAAIETGEARRIPKDFR